MVYDTREGREVANGPLDSGALASRGKMYWPSSGDLLLLYLTDNEMIGIPRDPGEDVRRWFLNCDGTANGFPRSIAEVDGRPEVLYSCEPTPQSLGDYQIAALDLDSNEFGPSRPGRSRLDEEVNQVSEMTSALRADFPGGMIGWTYYDDSSRRTSIYTTTYSRSGIDLREALSNGMVKPNDLETVIAIRDLDGSPLYLPVDLRYEDQDFTVGPLVDVAILD